MTIITLGIGKYTVAQGVGLAGHPSLLIRRRNGDDPTGTLLEPEQLTDENYELILDVRTPEAAAVLLTIAQTIAFGHGIEL